RLELPKRELFALLRKFRDEYREWYIFEVKDWVREKRARELSELRYQMRTAKSDPQARKAAQKLIRAAFQREQAARRRKREKMKKLAAEQRRLARLAAAGRKRVRAYSPT